MSDHITWPPHDRDIILGRRHTLCNSQCSVGCQQLLFYLSTAAKEDAEGEIESSEDLEQIESGEPVVNWRVAGS